MTWFICVSTYNFGWVLIYSILVLDRVLIDSSIWLVFDKTSIGLVLDFSGVFHLSMLLV